MIMHSLRHRALYKFDNDSMCAFAEMFPYAILSELYEVLVALIVRIIGKTGKVL